MGTTAEDLLLRIQGDSTSGQQAVQQLADTLSNALAKALSTVKQHTDDSNQATSALKKYLDDLTPSTQNAHAAFSDLKGTLTGLWENPTQELGNFVKALATDLAPALGAIGIAAGITVAVFAAVGAESIHLAEHSAQIGAAIQDAAYKTGASVPVISTWRGALEIAGGSLDQFSNAIFMMQRRMAEAGPQFEDGLARVGLTLAQLQGLEPDQQFLRIAEAIRTLPEPAARAAAAMELFGRPGRDLLPLIMKNLGDLNAESEKLGSTWSQQDAKAAEEFEMQTRALGLALDNIKVTIGRDLVPLLTVPLKFAVGSLGWFLTALKESQPARDIALLNAYLTQQQEPGFPAPPTAPKRFGDAGDVQGFAKSTAAMVAEAIAAADLQSHLAALQDKSASLTATQQAQARIMLEAGDGVEVVTGYLNKAFPQFQVTTEAVKKFSEALAFDKKYTEEFHAALGTLAPILTSSLWDGSVEGMLKLGGSVHDTAVYFGKSTEEVQKSQDQLTTWGKIVKLEAGEPLAEFETQLKKLGTAIPQQLFADTAKINVDLFLIEIGAKSSASALESIGTKARPSMADLDATLTKAQRAVSSISEDLQQLPTLMIQAFTGGGGISGALDALSTTISQSLFDPQKGIFKDITSKLTEGVGGAVSGMLGKTVGGLVGSVAGAALPVIGSLIGPAIEALMNIGGPSKDELAARDTFGSFQKQFGTLQQTIDGVGAAYAKAGKTGVEAQQALQRALDATHVSAAAEKAALEEINGVLNQQKQDERDLNTAVQTYKFSINELGPALQKQQLDTQAQQLMNDWRLLVGSGIALTTVNEHMASSVGDYLKLARQTGQEVPMAMQPIIQKMIDQGLLTDDAGKKITAMKDLGVTFAESMTEGFNKVVDKLTELINKISATTGAINAIPTSKTITVDTVYTSSGYLPGDQYDPNAGYASRGGWVTPEGIQYLADGVAQVDRLSRAMRRGTDTVPAMLTPGEAVLTKAAASSLGRGTIAQLNRGRFSPNDLAGRFAGTGGGDVNIHVDASGSIFKDRQAIRDLARAVGDELNGRVRQLRPVGLSQA